MLTRAEKMRCATKPPGDGEEAGSGCLPSVMHVDIVHELIDALVIGLKVDRIGVFFKRLDHLLEGFDELLVDGPKKGRQAPHIILGDARVADHLVQVRGATAGVDLCDHGRDALLKGSDDVALLRVEVIDIREVLIHGATFGSRGDVVR